MGFFTDLVNDVVTTITGPDIQDGKEPGRIDRLCQALGWTIDERDGNDIYLCFSDQRGECRHGILIVDGDDELAMIVCQSHVCLPTSRLPPEICGYLLNRNHTLVLGAWQVKENDQRNAIFTVGYECLAAGLTPPSFKWICEKIVNEVADFDKKMQGAGLLH